MERVSITARSTGWDYVEVTVHGYECATGVTSVAIQRRVAMGSEEAHLVLQRALEVLLARLEELHEADVAERSLGFGL